MSITALALGGWVSVYCGISLLRGNLAENQAQPADPRKILTTVGYVLIVLGLVVLVRAFLPHHP